MGHYDSLREQDREEAYIKRDKQTHEELSDFNDTASLEDRELLLKIAENIDDFRAMFRLMEKMKDFG